MELKFILESILFSAQHPLTAKELKELLATAAEQPEEAAAKASKEDLDKSGKFKRPIVTQILPATDYYPAEDYHQQYLEKRGQASCHIK